MAAFYYIKSGGTATGDAGRATTARTGSFATMGVSAFYDNISDALSVPTTSPVSGDSFYISDVHSHSYSTTITQVGPTGAPLFVVSVDDANADQYKSGAFEDNASGGGGDDYFFQNSWAIRGLSGAANDNYGIQPVDSSVSFKDGTFTLPGGTDRLYAQSFGGDLLLEDCTVNLNATTAAFFVLNGCALTMVGGVVATTTGGVAGLIDASGGNKTQFIGVDLDAVTGFLISNWGGATSDDSFFVHIDKCNLNSGLSGFIQETLSRQGFKILVTNSSSNSSAAEYQFYYQDFFGSAEDHTTTTRDETTAFPGGTDVSVEVITTASANTLSPFVFDLLSQYVLLSSASTDTIEIFLTSDTALTDNDVWVDLIYPDGTNKNVPNFLSTGNADPISTGTTLTTDSSSTWTSGKANNYVISVDTSGDVGADAAPLIRINVGAASATIYFDTSIGVAAS